MVFYLKYRDLSNSEVYHGTNKIFESTVEETECRYFYIKVLIAFIA